MHKISNFGASRHGWSEKMPSMPFVSRSHNDVPVTAPMKRPSTSASSPVIAPGTIVNLSFNVPFSSNLPGPEVEDVLWASPGAFDRWTHTEGTAPDTPRWKLPIHQQEVDDLRSLCGHISESTQGRIQASVKSAVPPEVPGMQRAQTRMLVTNVCLIGEAEAVKNTRARILNETPICRKCATVDIDYSLVIENDGEKDGVKKAVLDHLDQIAYTTRADIFLLQPKPVDGDSASFNGTVDTSLDQRLRCAIYGDMETAEHAKTRVLIMIDQILHRHVDAIKLELSMHTLICGRARKNIKLIESETDTAIYFPPPFPRLCGYCPPGAMRRQEDEILITGKDPEHIMRAKRKLHDLVIQCKTFVKTVVVTDSKIDNLILERLEKVQKIIENNGSYILLPPLGLQRGVVRVQGTDVLNVERTVRELMHLAGQFYSASWCITHPDPSSRPPSPDDVRQMLQDICISSDAEISFEKLNFHIFGSDDAVKSALYVIQQIPFVSKSNYNMSVKIELANEHKEFVSGKKNGKINKIMSHSSVQIVFDGFNEYNFYIVVRGSQYAATKSGLDLVEQEMPASIAFHVPDQYHKRIIGIGGQHIQRIMKKYSVFVKFSNAMDRGGLGKEEDDIKVDNVICRTPARNAQNLDRVKDEIMDMVEKAHKEYVEEHVIINRLYHRELIARMSEIQELEQKWNCKITFPSTEQASDVITVSGPEYMVPQAVDDFLGMVPERHELGFPATHDLKEFLRSDEFKHDVLEKMRSQHEVDVHLTTPPAAGTPETPENGEIATEAVTLSYTRNNAGGLKDAIDYLTSRLVPHGLDANAIRGNVPRPKSDSFEENLPFFNSKLLQQANPSTEHLATDSPTRASFVDGESGERSGFLDRLRKPGSMSSFSSMLERRKNGSNSPNSLFKHASSNASKASLVSLESQGSGYRNPWNDSGINLTDEDGNVHTNSNGWPTPAPRFPTTGGENGHSHNPHVGHHQSKFSFGNGTVTTMASSSSLNPGDATPRHYDPRASVDSGRPSTSHSLSGYPAPIGPPR